MLVLLLLRSLITADHGAGEGMGRTPAEEVRGVLKRNMRALAGREQRNNSLSLDDFAGVRVTAKPGFGNKYRNKSDTVDLMVLRIREAGGKKKKKKNLIT